MTNESKPVSKTPRVDAIALRLTGKDGLFCDDESLSQYNDLLIEAKKLETELSAATARIAELEKEVARLRPLAHLAAEAMAIPLQGGGEGLGNGGRRP